MLQMRTRSNGRKEHTEKEVNIECKSTFQYRDRCSKSKLRFHERDSDGQEMTAKVLHQL